MRIAAVRLFLFAFITFAISGCGKPARRYEFQGRVIEKVRETRTLVIDHPEIPDFMPAMTMPYRVSQDIDIANVEPGDKISARIVVRGDGNYELDQLKVTDSSGRGAASAPATRERPLSVGERIPNVDLLNQDGRVIRLSDFHGKTVLLTFIYTRCPMPNFCPRLSSLFASVQRELAKDPQLYSRTHLVTVSIDPKFDSPLVLRKYGLAYLSDNSQGFAHWSFTAPSPTNLKTLASAFGLLYEEEDNQIAHSMSTVVIDPKGRLAKEWRMSDWTPTDAIAEMRQAENEKQ